MLALTAGDRLEALPVDVLRRQGDQVMIAAASLAGREVVAERTPLLGQGVAVTPLRPDAAPGQVAAASDTMVSLSPERRAALVVQVEADAKLPADAKARLLAELSADRVPAATLARLTAPVGG